VSTIAALVLPPRSVLAAGQETDTRFLLLLASLALWGVSMGSSPVRKEMHPCLSISML
jgi:hypothetical protein